MTAMKIIMSILNSDPPTLRNPSKHSKEFQHFIHCCLQKNPRKRATAEELLKHKFFNKAKDEDYLVDNFLYEVKDLEDRIGENLRALGEGKSI
jgi:serine/threonine-protein kinase OSR1/STK39